MNKLWFLAPAALAYVGVGTVTIASDLPLGRQDDPARESPEPKSVPAPVATALASGSGAISSGSILISLGQTPLGHIVEGVVGEEAYLYYPPPAACERLLHAEQAAILDLEGWAPKGPTLSRYQTSNHLLAVASGSS